MLLRLLSRLPSRSRWLSWSVNTVPSWLRSMFFPRREALMPSTRSPHVALLGQQAPPHRRVVPHGHDDGAWEQVVALAALFGIVLDPWQELVLRDSLKVRPGGRWASQQVGLSVPRQNGKSVVVIVRALAGVLLFGERLVIVSAHEADTYRESTWADLLRIYDESPELRSRVRQRGVMNAINRESMTFTNGAKIKFKARTGTGGRGFSSDCLMLDEAQILSARTWASIFSTMSARKNPQVWLTGTPPTPEDDAHAFSALRSAALSGASTALTYLEWSDTGDPAVEETRRNANPAWDTRINHEIVQGEFETYPPSRFSLERCGVWASDLGRQSILPNWSTLVTDRPAAVPSALGVAMDVDQAWCSLGAVLASDPPHVGPALRLPVKDRARFVAEVARIQATTGCPVVIDNGGPARVLVPDLEAAGVVVDRTDLPGFVQACSDLVQRVEEGSISHGAYPELDSAVDSATWRQVGDRRVFGRRSGDVSMLEAVALALSATRESVTYDALASVL